MIILLAQKTDAAAIAAIHKTEIKQGFLGSLGLKFLTYFYEALINSPASFCVVAKEQNQVVGFISGVTDINIFYRYFLKKYFFQSAVLLSKKVFSISSVKKIFETLWYPVKEYNLPPAELLTMAVATQFQGQGIAGRMFLEFIKQMKDRNIKAVKVMVGEDLKNAIAFYQKHHFIFVKNINVHGGALSKVYIYNL